MTEDINRPAGDPSTLGQPGSGPAPITPAGPPVPPPHTGAPAPAGAGLPGTGDRGQHDTKETAKQEAAEVASSAKQEASHVAESAKQSAQQVGQTAKEEAKRTAGQAKRQAQQLLREGQSELSDQAGTQQQRLAGGLRAFSTELDQMVDGAEQDGLAAQLARWAAETTDDAGRWLEDRDPAGVLEDVKRFARRRPGAFIVAAAGAGLLVGRIARSLRDEASDDDDDDRSTGSGVYAPPPGGQQPVTSTGYQVPASSGYQAPLTTPGSVPPSPGPIPPVTAGEPYREPGGLR